MLHRGLVILLALAPVSSAFTVGRSPASGLTIIGSRSAAATSGAISTTRLYSDTEDFRDGKKKKVRSDSEEDEGEGAAAEDATASGDAAEGYIPVDEKEPLLQSEGDSDILNSPAFLKRKVDVLNSDLAKIDAQINTANAQLEEGKAEWGPELDRLQAEYLNVQNRMAQQSKEGNPLATLEVVRSMLSVLDNYDRAFNAVNAETEDQKAVEADYMRTRAMIYDTFEKLGVTEVPTVGAEFDYEVHQAVMQRPSDEYDEGVVCEELAKGYVLGDKLIRAAMVSVAA